MNFRLVFQMVKSKIKSQNRLKPRLVQELLDEAKGSHSAATVADNHLPLAHHPIQQAVGNNIGNFPNSAQPIPRVVIAGEPSRKPLVTNGDSGSKGTVFCWQ